MMRCFHLETLSVVPEADVNANEFCSHIMTIMFLSANVKQFIVQKQTKISILYRYLGGLIISRDF